jgi:hypothetical protein
MEASKDFKMPEKIDMSPKAIALRLKKASQLRKLCLKLAQAKPVDKTFQENSARNNAKKADGKTQ